MSFGLFDFRTPTAKKSCFARRIESSIFDNSSYHSNALTHDMFIKIRIYHFPLCFGLFDFRTSAAKKSCFARRIESSIFDNSSYHSNALTHDMFIKIRIYHFPLCFGLFDFRTSAAKNSCFARRIESSIFDNSS